MAERVGFEPTVAKATHALQACLIGHSSTSPRTYCSRLFMTEYSLLAERVGFEPTLRLRGDRFSRAAPSTTRTPLLALKL